jgi:integrase
MKLTATGLPSLKEGLHRDDLLPPLHINVGKKRKTWLIRHFTGGQHRKDIVGYFPAMSLAEARDAARLALGRIEVGAPIAEEKPKHPKDNVLTVGKLIDDYERMKIRKGGRGLKSLPEAMRAVRKGLDRHLKLAAAELTKADMRSIRDRIAKESPSMSDRFLAYCGPVWKWAAIEEKVPANIVPEVLRVGPGLVKRDRILTADELAAIWKACADLGSYGRLVRFLMVLGIRRGEGAGLRHGRVIDGRWKLTKEETKAGREHLVRLPKLAIDQLGNGGPVGDLVFPGRSVNDEEVMLSGWAKLKKRLDKASGVSDWVLHDIRRTVASGMQSLSVPRDVIEQILNHAQPGVAGHYLHDAMEKQKADAWKRWATHLEHIINDEPRKVVKIRG